MIGATLGVEEEFHLVDAATFELAARPALADRALAQQAGPHLHPEMLTSQLEAATEVCTDLAELRAALVAGRREAAEAARRAGTVLLATSTHPLARLAEIDIMARDRYDRLLDRFGAVVRQLNLCGTHVHVSVPDLDTAVAIMDHARPYLPLLLALTASSPYHEGADTGYDSFRIAELALWPQGGAPPGLGSGAGYLAMVEQLTGLGLIEDATALLWDVRPSARYPTIEFRIADMCPDVDDTLLYAALVRSLVRTLGARVERDVPAPELPDPVLRALRWQAARSGLGGAVWSPARAAAVPAAVALDDLAAELRPDLERHGELPLVDRLLARVRAHGNAATRQRQILAETGSLHEVVRAAVRLTAGAG